MREFIPFRKKGEFKMRKNKLLAFGLVAMMAVSLTACGGGEKENETTPTPTVEATVAPTEAPKSAEEAPTR